MAPFLCLVGSSGCPFTGSLVGSPDVLIFSKNLVFTGFLLLRLVVHVLVRFLVRHVFIPSIFML